MAAKFYAVKTGRKPGVYTTWEECEKQTKFYAGANFKAFTSREEAEAFCGIRAASKLAKSVTAKADALDIYVDGSYRDGKYSWGFVVYKGGKEIHAECGVGTNADAAAMHNVAGELSATMRAARWLAANNQQRAIIHHDYQGISSWVTGDWKAKNIFTQHYANFIRPLYDLGLFTFNKVAGHTGINGNERADQLCALAFDQEVSA